LKPTTYKTISHQRLVSSNTSDVQTATVPNGTSAVELAVETTSARVTLDGSDPSAVNAPSLVFPFGQVPIFRPWGPGMFIKFVSTGASSVIQLVYYQ
jgi:hypothetical protein